MTSMLLLEFYLELKYSSSFSNLSNWTLVSKNSSKMNIIMIMKLKIKIKNQMINNLIMMILKSQLTRPKRRIEKSSKLSFLKKQKLITG